MTFGNGKKPTSERYHREPTPTPTPVYDWVNMANEEVFYNQNTKELCIVIDATKEDLVTALPPNPPISLINQRFYSIKQKAQNAFIILWQFNYGHITMEPDKYGINHLDLVQRNVFYLKEWHMPTKKTKDAKYLFAISEADTTKLVEGVALKMDEEEEVIEVETTESEDIPEQQTEEEDQTKTSSGSMKRPGKKPEAGSFVVFEAVAFVSIMKGLKDAMMSIGKDYECAYRNGTYNVPNLRFGRKITKIEKLESKIFDILSKSNVSVNNVDQISFRKALYGEVEKIDEVWTYVVAQDWERLESGTSNMYKKDPFDDANIVNLVFNAHEIVKNFKSAEPLTYDKFIQKYFISLPNTDAIDPIQAGKSLVGGFGTSGTGAAACAGNFVGSFLETVPGNEVSGQLTKYSDCIENRYPETSYTAAEKRDLERAMNDPILLNRRIQDAINTRVEDVDPMINQLKQSIESSKTLDELYYKVINPLGAEGIAKLMAEGILLQLKCLTLDAALKQICISALQSTISTQIYELYLNTVITRKGSKLILTPAFMEMWVQIYGPDYPPPTAEEIQPLSYTPPPNFDITKKKSAFVIGIPSLHLNNPLVANARETFVAIVEQDMVSPYDMLEELLTNTAFVDTSENGLLVAGIMGLKDSVQLEAKIQKPKIKPLTMPYIPPVIIPNLGDLGKLAIKFAEEALKRAATEIAKRLMIELLDAVFGYCEDPLLAENILGSSKDAVLNVLGRELCSPNATPDEISQTVKSLLDSFSVWDTNSPDTIPTSGDVRQMMEAASESMSPQETIEVLNGTASGDTYRSIKEAINSTSNEKLKNALSSESSIENMFASLGTLINRNALQALKDNGRILNTPTNSLICADPFQVVAADEATRQALVAKGLNDEQIAAQMKDATDRALQKLDDTVKNLLNSNSMAKMGNMSTNEDGSLPAMSSDPTKPEEGLFPMEDAATQNYNSWMFNDVFDSLDGLVINDLMNGNSDNFFNKGFLDMTLSSKKGRGYVKITDEFYSTNGNGELEFDFALKAKKVPEYISNLYQMSESTSTTEVNGREVSLTEAKAASSYDNIGVSSTQITGTYSAPTGNASSYIEYTIGGDILKTSTDNGDPNAGFSNNVDIFRKFDQEVLDYVSEISPQSQMPNKILGNWCQYALERYLPSNSDTLVERNTFIQSVQSYVSEKMYPNILQAVVDQYSSMATSNNDSWIYGDGEISSSVVDLDESEYGRGSFYLRTCKQDFKGWMKIYNSAVPIISDGQDKVPLFNFVDIKKDCDEYYDNFPIDNRIQATTIVFKKYKEPPFARINNRVNNALMAGLMKATARLQIYDSLIKGTPFFKIYKMNENNYGDILTSYICSTILQEVLEESLQVTAFEIRPMGFKGYYYIFLEQLVQCYSNMVYTGLFQPSPDGSLALRSLTEKIQSWSGMPPRIKKMKEMIDDSLPEIKVILADIIKEQMNKIGENTKSVYSPLHEDLMDNVINSWLFGGLSGAKPFDGPLPVPISLEESEQYPTGDLDFPFILEKFVRLEDASGTSKILSPQEAIIENLALYESISIGTRMVLYLPATVFTDLNLEPPVERYAKDTFKALFDTSRSFMVEPQNQSGDSRILIPLFEKERPANLQDITDNSSYQSLALEMAREVEFRTLFEKSVPMKDILSFVTIYTIENFIESLGVEKRDRLFSEFSFWDGDTFQTSKKYLRKITQQSYYGRDSEYINQINSDMAKPYLNMAAAMGFGAAEKGLNDLIKKIPKWKRKKRKPMPPGTDPCEGLNT